MNITKKQKIKEFNLFGIKILSIVFDGIHDCYILFNKFCIAKIKNDRDFWNDWE